MATSQADLVKGLVDSGVHFGHRVSRWNPKMEPYIHGKRNMIHIIDVKETIKGLLRAKKLITQTVQQGKDILATSGLPIIPANDLGDAARKIVAEVKSPVAA